VKKSAPAKRKKLQIGRLKGEFNKISTSKKKKATDR
jgi:hypothetical protein